MNFIIGEHNRVWEDRECIGFPLPNRAKTFSEEATLKEVWEWILSDKLGESRGNIELIVEGK